MKRNKLIKSIHILFAIFAVTLTVTATACSDSIASDSAETTTVQAQKPILKIMLKSESRTVDLPSLNQFKNFKLTGKKSEENSQVQNLGNQNGYASVSELQNAEIELPAGAAGSEWEFTLKADLQLINNSTAIQCTATATTTIFQGQNVVKFNIAIESNSEQGTGDFSVTFDWSADESNTGKVTKVMAVLQDTAENGTETVYNNISLNGQKVTIADTNITTGTYRLKVSFFDNEAQIAYWQEIVQITKGITSTAKRTIGNFTKTYSIIYELNGEESATIVNPCPTKVTKASDLFEKGSPTWNGHTFIDWYTDNGTWQHPFVVKDITADTTVYARWIGENDPFATKNTITQKIQDATSTNKTNSTTIKVLGSFTQDDFTATVDALKAREDNDSNDSNYVYISLDFSETKSDVTNFSNTDFYLCKNLAGIVLPDSISNMNSARFGENCQYIKVSETNPNYSSIDGVLYSKDQTALVALPAGKEYTNNAYITPDSVTTIKSGAFIFTFGVSPKINSITIGENVTVIEQNAFNTNLTSEVDFIDQESIWGSNQPDSDDIYNFSDYFINSNTYNKYGYEYYKLTGQTFATLIATAQVTELTVIEGAGTEEENKNLDYEGFNSIQISSINEKRWLAISTKQGYKYHLYYLGRNGDEYVNKFTNTDDIKENLPYYCALSAYNSNGKTCYIKDTQFEVTAEFTAQDNITYIKIKEKGYDRNRKVYLLIREEAPESSGGNEGGE